LTCSNYNIKRRLCIR